MSETSMSAWRPASMRGMRVVQVRLMGDEADVAIVAEALQQAGFASTGSTPNRSQPGVRTYGVIAVPAAE